jgi:pyrroline-5-carboxylate reductase
MISIKFHKFDIGKGEIRDMENHRIGFLGTGNMASALIKGMINSGAFGREQLVAFDKDGDALQRVSSAFGLKALTSNMAVAHESNTLVLCVKPQNIEEVLDEIKDGIHDTHLLISIAAGIPLQKIVSKIGREIPMIRVMPNTPALVQEGISALAPGKAVDSQHLAIAKKMFGAVGETVTVQESMMDAVTALSGSGPGYVFRIMECLVDAGVKVGLDRDVSHRLVLQTFRGASALATGSGEPLSVMRERVTSKGGTTEAGLSVFEELGLEAIIHRAIEAAHARSLELGKGR